ncbi:putative glycosyl hydrolase [Teratosphaeria destructans]|uniref:mannan endo-1,6-alpha-mannosidase n=1 Tax=Teratosphaeria destructans TaxID=418781 RepID=A0A9W7SN63_9PEZI|nr:putative glycosyl hydrolase [Teratosphaeria destructans]
MSFRYFVLAVYAAVPVSGLALNVRTKDATISAAGTLAGNLMKYYDDGGSDGVIPLDKSNWWESATAWNGLIQHWYYTGDSQYNDEIAAGICAQAGITKNFSGPNTLGNDDQLWWALTAMTAAEYNLSSCTSETPWLNYAQTVYNDVASRWDTQTCNGGLRWQISPYANGYDYKASIANGLLFQLAARLARYTGNNAYSDQAASIWNWTRAVGFIHETSYAVYDGATPSQDCTSLTTDQWSYNVGVYLYGVAVMLNYTQDDATWSSHLNGLVTAAIAGFTDSNGTLQESGCEPSDSCDLDQLSFKAYLARWLALSAALVPATARQITPILQSSVQGALASVNAGPGNGVSGFKWTTGTYDDNAGVGQQLAALEIVGAQLAVSKALPVARRRVPRKLKI